MKLSKPDPIELYNLWQSAQKEGKTFAEFASNFDSSYHTIYRAVEREKRSREGKVRRKIPSPPDIEQRLYTLDESGNYIEADSGRTSRITTLDDLIKACGIDLSEWIVERYVVNKWEVGAKAAKRQLIWEKGQIVEGSIDDPGELTVEPLFQVKAWLIRSKPIAIEPTVQPISISIKPNRGRPPKTEAIPEKSRRSALIVPDLQIGFSKNPDTGVLNPFHDRRAMDIVLQIASSYPFDDIVLLGDVLDLPEWSDKFVRSPDYYFTTQPAIIEASWFLSRLRSISPEAKISVIEGNHDLRIKTQLATHLSAAYHLRAATEVNLPPSLSIPRLLSLDNLDIDFIDGYPNGAVWLNDRLACVHGDKARSNPGDTAKAMIANATRSVIFGHIHRIERSTRTINERGGAKIITALSPGCLCRVDGVVPGHRLDQNWQQGLAVAHYTPDGWHAIETISIESGEAVWAGRVYTGDDSIDDLVEDTRWQF